MPMKANAREYRTWYSMIQRCCNFRDGAYKHYGGRGIRVCKRWRNFHRFRLDMGPRPFGMTIERKNNNGDYTPKNCRWATNKEQQRNKRNNRRMTFGGRTMTQAEWSEVTGINVVALNHRRRAGWSVEEMLTIAVDKKASMARYWRRQAALRTHCKRGHELTDNNIYKRGVSSKDCRKCALFRAIRFREKQREVTGWNGRRRVPNHSQEGGEES